MVPLVEPRTCQSQKLCVSNGALDAVVDELTLMVVDEPTPNDPNRPVRLVKPCVKAPTFPSGDVQGAVMSVQSPHGPRLWAFALAVNTKSSLVFGSIIRSNFWTRD